jgi:uncharacterized phage-associated protein
MPPPYRPLALANEFIIKSASQGAEHMKLQKLVYYAYGWWLTEHAYRVTTEAPQVWKYGPVFETLYHQLSNFKDNPIRNVQRDHPFQPAPRVDDEDVEVCDLVDFVWEKYGGFDSIQLSNRSHKRGSPWRQVAEGCSFRIPRHTEIPDPVIQAYFQDLAARSEI